MYYSHANMNKAKRRCTHAILDCRKMKDASKSWLINRKTKHFSSFHAQTHQASSIVLHRGVETIRTQEAKGRSSLFCVKRMKTFSLIVASHSHQGCPGRCIEKASPFPYRYMPLCTDVAPRQRGTTSIRSNAQVKQKRHDPCRRREN